MLQYILIASSTVMKITSLTNFTKYFKFTYSTLSKEQFPFILHTLPNEQLKKNLVKYISNDKRLLQYESFILSIEIKD